MDTKLADENICWLFDYMSKIVDKAIFKSVF